MTMQCKQVDIGDKCVACLRSTSFGSGTEEYIGWLCPECNWYECDRCNEKIYCDEDCTPYDVYGDHEPTEFSDGAYRVHYECLTEKEKQLMEENND